MKLGQFILIFGFLGVIFLFSIGSFLDKDNAKSVFENRTLAQEPVKDLKLIWSGQYFKQYESYFADQFVLRDRWVRHYTDLQMAMPKTYVNGFYIAKDNHLIAQPTTNFPKAELDASAKSLNELGAYLQKKGTPLYYFPLPSKANMARDLLPSYVPKGTIEANKEYLMSKIDNNLVNVTDISGAFKKNRSPQEIADLYFKTDHHWNIEGAILGYQQVIKRLAKDFPSISTDTAKSTFTHSCINNPFVGSLNKQLLLEIDLHADNVCYYMPKNYSFNDYKVYRNGINENNRTTSSAIYSTFKKTANERVEYGSAYTWDLTEFNIVNSQSTNTLRALIIKDSYGNASSFHMAHHFKETTVYDIRHNPSRTLYSYLNTHQFDLVIIEYNDTYLSGPLFNFSRTVSAK
ncbi:hypothetical protein CN918_26005 [Priestia megaterium]|nr:hypothetical protein CN918_26005 [Priestia megaterium]